MLLRMLLPLFFCIAILFAQVDASRRDAVQFTKHHALHRASVRGGDEISNTTGTYNSSAAALVAEAQARMAIANKLRLENPRFNKHSFPSDHLQANVSKAPPIISTRGVWRRDNGPVPIDYSIPPELRQAAKEVAESTSHTSAVSKYAEEAAVLKAQYWVKTNDTNTPAPASEPMNPLAKRDSVFWMESMNMNGKAPYAGGAGTYTVFRNVKDYGAVGDGIHDDTAAINAAISDGARCGLTCGSSTAKPAVIYFPSGVYLVSTSIIQYYNTQFFGDPTDRPVILGAASFSGLGVISSDVYIDGGDSAEWYVPQNNFLRSIRNLIIDVTNTPLDKYICGLHWQVAQGTDLQNVDFYMAPGSTQQGIYMENGSGGFLSDLYFYGGNFGAYLGNQQFTSRNLIFRNCLTAVQIHWDWAWTMQGVTVIGRGISSGSPSTGITIVGGAGGGAGSTGQGVGSFVLLDSTMRQLTVGISTTLLAENSTSLLLQNVALSNVNVAVEDSAKGTAMLAGGISVNIPSWGFGNIVAGENGTSSFQNGNSIPAANRSSILTTGSSGNFFARGAPTYEDVPISNFINVKSYGAKGDGVVDDTSIINQVLAIAANASQVVFFPYGMYVVTDTVRVPLGSRIVGQVWPQIVASGPMFQNMFSPRPVVQVGRRGDAGTIEITDMMVSVRGPTAGAVLMEWNVHETTQGSAALWHTHLRVGGNVGSSLQAANCPKLTGSVNPKCIAASLLLHLTPTSSAYVENVWAWVADHDMDITAQTQIDVYSGRGILIESQGPSWFWGTASEHNVMYQYQLSNARDIFFSMIQTESPYFQPGPKAPAPFTSGMFPDDPDFTSCNSGSTTCAMSWALRMLDSNSVYIYSSGLYSWFNGYSQTCLVSENCQDRSVDIENSSGVWVYALTTKAIKEMVSPVKVPATLAAANQNGYLSSILAWLEGSTAVVGNRFPGWTIFPEGSLANIGLNKACEAAMYQSLKCDTSAQSLLSDGYQGNVGNATRLSLMCDPGCADSLRYLHYSIVSACAETPYLMPGWPLVGVADMVWSHWNETCFKDPTTGLFCDSVISNFTAVTDISQMPSAEMCSYCNLEKYSMMQSSAFSVYDAAFETRYRYIASACRATVTNFDPTPDGFYSDVNVTETTCTSGEFYTTLSGDTCDSIATAKSLSSATLWWINPSVSDCSSISAGIKLCLPLACSTIHTVAATESCMNITTGAGIFTSELSTYNPGLNWDCDHLHNGTIKWGSTLCVSPPGGGYTTNSTSPGAGDPWTGGDGYREPPIAPPSGAIVAAGTTTSCGAWYKHTDDSVGCAQICLENQIIFPLFLSVNPSLHSATCNADLVVGTTYCIHPTRNWNAGVGTGSTSTLTTVSSSSATVTTKTTSTNTASISSSTISRSTTTPTTSTTPITSSTPTQPGNGVATPSPIHPGGMVTNCNKFTKVNPGDTCDIISFFNGPISTGDFIVWNAGVGGNLCNTLRVDTYVCIGLIPSTTQPNNGIATPLPIQTGMVTNCANFVRVHPGDTCDIISFYNGLRSTADFILWNSGVGGNLCNSLHAETYACIGLVPGTGTPTKPWNGIATPMPTHPGMVGNCNKFTRVNPGDTCDIISFFNGPISTGDFIRWNTGVGGQACNTLQVGTYVCIGVVR